MKIMRSRKLTTTGLLVNVNDRKFSVDRSLPPFMLLLLILFFSAFDGVTIFTVIDGMFLQSMFLSIFVTVGLAIFLNFLPYKAAHYTMKEDKDALDKAIISALYAGIVIMSLALFLLRWHSMESAFSTAGASMAVRSACDTIQAGTNTPVEISWDKAMMTIILGISPFFTSLVVFAITCRVKQSIKRDIINKQNDIMILEQLKIRKIQIQEMKAELSRDLEGYDKKQLEIEKNKLTEQGELLKERVRQLVALKIGTADAVSTLLEGE